MSASKWLAIVSTGSGLLARFVPVTAPVTGPVAMFSGLAASVAKKAGQ